MPRESAPQLGGASVTLTNLSKGTNRTVVTNDQGQYSFPVVPVGAYQLEISSPGFELYKKTGSPRAVVPSCLLLDISLPGLNGLELQKRVAAERTDMPIIFITGYGDIPKTVQAMKAGAVEFLTKPFKEEVLLSAIRQALERSRLRRRRCRSSGTVMPRLLHGSERSWRSSSPGC